MIEKTKLEIKSKYFCKTLTTHVISTNTFLRWSKSMPKIHHLMKNLHFSKIWCYHNKFKSFILNVSYKLLSCSFILLHYIPIKC